MMTSKMMFKVEKLSGSFLSLLRSVMQTTVTKTMLQMGGENAKFCTSDPTLHLALSQWF